MSTAHHAFPYATIARRPAARVDGAELLRSFARIVLVLSMLVLLAGGYAVLVRSTLQ